MIMLVSGATQTMRRYQESPYLGWLLTPRNGNSISAILAAGCAWAADNDCYQHLDRHAYIRMLRRIAKAHDRSRLKFVAAPDVVGDSNATLARWRLWFPVLRYLGLPAAFVAQDGQAVDTVPWFDIAALFIGGSTRFKEVESAQLIQEARRRGVWVHVGRVNTIRRARLMDAIGPVDSIDGTCFSKMPDKFIPWMLRGLHYRQHGLPEVLCSS